MSKKDEGVSPVATVLDLATTTAKGELGAGGSKKKVSATATLSTTVTEGGKVKSNSTDATVSLGMSSSEVDEPAAACCDKCGTADCCKK